MDDVSVLGGIDEPLESGTADAGEISQTPDEPESGPEAAEPSNPYTTKFSRELRAFLNAQKTADPANAKFYEHVKDMHGRMFALSQIDPKGVDGVRERYELLNSLAYGEQKGVEAVSAMQQRIQEMDEVDQRLAAGDPLALESLGEEFNAGLAKLTPTILARIQAADPEAYSAAVLPHFVDALSKSDLVRDFNSIVDTLNRQPPSYLTPEQKTQWVQEQLQGVYGAVGKMAAWFNAQQQAAQGKGVQNANGNGPRQAADPTRSSEPSIEEQRQTLHWDTKIKPEAAKLESARFNELLKPIAHRLQLNDRQKAAAYADFQSRISSAMKADPDYMRAIQNYRRQSNPDPAKVLNLIKTRLAGKAIQTAFDELSEDRGWTNFLRGKSNGSAQPAARQPQGARTVVEGFETRTVKPPMSEIDHRNTPLEWLRPDKDGARRYLLYGGKKVRVLASA